MFTLSRRTAQLLVMVPLTALLAAACEHNLGLGLTPPGPLATITVTPNPVTLAIGAIQPFVATGRDAAGNLVSITPTWSVVAPAAGTINSSSGLFTAGTTPATYANTIRATSGAIFGSATVTVTAPGALATITVTPNPGSAVVGGTIQYTATGRDVANVIVPIPAPLVWSVLNATAGTINSSGLFTAGATPGTYSNTIRATSGGISGFATAIVTAFVSSVSLGNAAPYGILAGSAVTCITTGTINADVGIHPGSAVSGFPPCVYTGTLHAADAVALAAQNDLTTAYNTLANKPCDLVITPADLDGRTLPAGVYCAATSMAVAGVTGQVTLDGGGNANAEFVFQIGSTLTTGTGANIRLINGAQAKNVWWQVGSSATLGTSTTFRGNIVALTSITLNDNATMCGRALARNGAVSVGNGNTITLPPTCS